MARCTCLAALLLLLLVSLCAVFKVNIFTAPLITRTTGMPSHLSPQDQIFICPPIISPACLAPPIHVISTSITPTHAFSLPHTLLHISILQSSCISHIPNTNANVCVSCAGHTSCAVCTSDGRAVHSFALMRPLAKIKEQCNTFMQPLIQ